jgi:hypothetical protein
MTQASAGAAADRPAGGGRGEEGHPGAPDYSERLWPSAPVWVVALLFATMAGIVPVPYGAVPAVAAGVVVGALIAAALVLSTPLVEVRDGHLHAGRAHVPLALLGPVTALDRAAMRNAQGRELDARAFMVTRGWIGGGCRIELLDPADPTPYWLVSTRRPERLAAALTVDPRRAG